MILGLIGDNIAQSKSPLLHEAAGKLCGLDVSYRRLIPTEEGLGFEALLARAQADGFRGVNVTYPYKERVVASLPMSDPTLRAIGAVNTVVFDADGPKGFNTDYTGFIQVYRAARGGSAPGTVCLIGSGGVGRAIAFGLAALGAETIRCVDRDLSKASALAQALGTLGGSTELEVFEDAESAAQGADGIINCTPLGMGGIGGTPLAASAMGGGSWAFDAVYTPADTQFLTDAARAGLDVISGYELFFHQGVAAWVIFSETHPDQGALRAAIQGAKP